MVLFRGFLKKEKQKFISFHGVEIGRLQRRAGLEYTQPVEELSLANKLDVIKVEIHKTSLKILM